MFQPIVTFGDKTGFCKPFSHLQSCYGRGKTLQEQDIVLKKLLEKARQDIERKGGQFCRTFHSQRGLSTTMPCMAIYE